MIFFFSSVCILMWHFRSRWKLAKNFPHLQVWDDYPVPPTSNHPSAFPAVLRWVGTRSLSAGGKKDRKRCSGLPRANSPLLPSLPSFPRGCPLDCVSHSLERVGEPAGGTQSRAGGGSLALTSACSRWVLSPDPNRLRDDWFSAQGWISCQGRCLPGDLSPRRLVESFL